MTCNRDTYALLGLLLLECVQDERSFPWLESGNFDAIHKVPPEQLFGAYEVPHAAGPGHRSKPTSGVDAVYGAYLHAHYALAADSRLWRLYRRRD